MERKERHKVLWTDISQSVDVRSSPNGSRRTTSAMPGSSKLGFNSIPVSRWRFPSSSMDQRSRGCSSSGRSSLARPSGCQRALALAAKSERYNELGFIRFKGPTAAACSPKNRIFCRRTSIILDTENTSSASRFSLMRVRRSGMVSLAAYEV